jgi:hypothetical protein
MLNHSGAQSVNKANIRLMRLHTPAWCPAEMRVFCLHLRPQYVEHKFFFESLNLPLQTLMSWNDLSLAIP